MLGHFQKDPPILRFTRISKGVPLRVVLIILICALLIPAATCPAYDWPFNNGANWGGTGLMEIPNARILGDGEVRMGYAQALPYRWFTADMGVLPGLEFGARLTQITNYDSPYYFGNLDRAFDLKYQILAESRNLPAIAVGVNDFHGTQLFPSEYLVMSRQLYPFDFTLGIGTKRLKGDLQLPFLDDFGLFGGVEWVINDRLKLSVEYNPVHYEDDKPSARGVPEGAALPFNFGLRAALFRGVNLGLSFQRGDTFGLQLQLQSVFGERILPQNPDPPHQTAIDRRPFRDRDRKKMLAEIHKAIHDSGFSKVSVYTDGQDLTAEFENGKYFSNQKAAGRVLRILLYYSPSDTRELKAILKNRDMPVLEVSVKPEYLEKFLLKKIPEDLFYDKLLKVRLADKRQAGDDQYLISDPDPLKRFSFDLNPDITTYWFDLSNYLEVRAGIKPSVTTYLWPGGYIHARYDIPFYSDVNATSTPAPDPVRSDIAEYMGMNFSFDRLMADQTFRFSKRFFGRVALGYFEKMYAGAGAECLYVLGDGRLALGLEGNYVIKRKPHTQLSLLDFERQTLFLTGYYYYPPLDLTLETRYGQFLAGDVGWMFDISRRYPTGATIGIFYTITDTDGVKGSFNQGYNNKGVYIGFPLRMFLKRDSGRMYYYAMSPWTRDVGATVYDGTDLFTYVRDLLPSRFSGKIDEISE